MVIIKGKYNEAIVFTDNIESSAYEQIMELCNQEFVKGSKIRIMPDVHAGAGCVIGTTMTVKDKVVPNLVGVDIGCGIDCIKLKNKDIDLVKLDSFIKRNIPHGTDVHKKKIRSSKDINLLELTCKKHVDIERGYLSIGSLGGGNHFIEIDRDQEGNLYLLIHSGSRHIGKQVAEYHQKVAKEHCKDNVPGPLKYLEGKLLDNYLNDMRLMQDYAVLNRRTIAELIINGMNFDVDFNFATIHNYIDFKSYILRKGAVSAQKGEKLLIPLNMRDGALISVGKGNPEWNYSAPHGAGRVLSRNEAKSKFDINEFKKSMEGIYTSCVSHSTIDEAPMAYKPMDEIIKYIGDTVEILTHIKPIYNFKAP